ncbi:MAG: hypothetical protein JW839_10720, partial [Candidatus Lokiarchaeota archaeon]|nr:hypothetical protein [Candidatus Lokiarchaeota archaeon]
MIPSDLPTTYNTTFSGTTGSPTFVSAFTNTTGQNHSITLQNSFANEGRSSLLDLSSFERTGFSITKVDVNVTSNQVVAQDDWVHVSKVQSSTSKNIDNATTRAENEMLAQQIAGDMRFRVKNISLYMAITILNGQSANNPRLQLWDNASSAFGDVPGTSLWSTDLPNTTGGARTWIHTGCDFIINASAPSNRSWYV